MGVGGGGGGLNVCAESGVEAHMNSSLHADADADVRVEAATDRRAVEPFAVINSHNQHNQPSMPTSPHPRHASTSPPSNLQSPELKTSGPASRILNPRTPALALAVNAGEGEGEGDTQGVGGAQEKKTRREVGEEGRRKREGRKTERRTKERKGGRRQQNTHPSFNRTLCDVHYFIC
ncbi:hypothetical protein CVT25_007553 [Psilocybe cyanescens]|uniref:Uncharacterized protein n=1 Tax=Psilocybe cyanescens TaxID=93625 RepID=A0A409XGH0_PSICY|nr:hypothetical protein CVT25_007553 [Psilocybe cyanescens]